MSRLDHRTPTDSFTCSSPGSLPLQVAIFVLDLKMQLFHLAGELKEQSDVTGVQRVALPLMATRGSSGIEAESSTEESRQQNSKAKLAVS